MLIIGQKVRLRKNNSSNHDKSGEIVKIFDNHTKPFLIRFEDDGFGRYKEENFQLTDLPENYSISDEIEIVI